MWRRHTELNIAQSHMLDVETCCSTASHVHVCNHEPGLFSARLFIFSNETDSNYLVFEFHSLHVTLYIYYISSLAFTWLDNQRYFCYNLLVWFLFYWKHKAAFLSPLLWYQSNIKLSKNSDVNLRHIGFIIIGAAEAVMLWAWSSSLTWMGKNDKKWLKLTFRKWKYSLWALYWATRRQKHLDISSALFIIHTQAHR